MKKIELELNTNSYNVTIWETSNNIGHIKHEWVDSNNDFQCIVESFAGKTTNELLDYIIEKPVFVLGEDDIKTIRSMMKTKCIVTFDHIDKNGDVVLPNRNDRFEFESSDPKDEFLKMIENGSFDNVERIGGTSLLARLSEGDESNVTTIKYIEERPMSLLDAFFMIDEASEVLGSLFRRSMVNGSSLDDDTWDNVYIDGTYNKAYFDKLDESDQIALENEIDEKVEQVTELIKIVSERKPIATEYELRIVMKGYPIDDLDVENYFDTFDKALKRGEEMKAAGLIEGFEITKMEKVYNSFGVEQLVERL